MDFIAELWMPILIAAVLVFLVSSVFHVMLPIHKKDYKPLTDEASVLTALRGNNVEHGGYMFPYAADMKEFSTPEMQAKIKEGPVGWVTILPPGGWNMGRSLILWFIFTIIVGVFTGYISWFAIGNNAANEYLDVFRVTGTVAFLGYGVGYMHESIWNGAPWGITMKFIVEGFVYALVTAGTFAWLWPTVEAVTP